MTSVAVISPGTNGGGLVAPLPRCPVHGQMHYRSETESCGAGIRIITSSKWICHGWDGEGCGYAVDHDDLPWVPARPRDWIQFERGG